jgi:phosphoglycerate kinase
VNEIPPQWCIVDIGPQTVALYAGELKKAKTVVWNGPMGVMEIPKFSQGTDAIIKTLASLKATTIIGGGSTAEAVEKAGLVDKMTHVSTGGGASLEFLEGKTLPGVAVLQDKGS